MVCSSSALPLIVQSLQMYYFQYNNSMYASQYTGLVLTIDYLYDYSDNNMCLFFPISRNARPCCQPPRVFNGTDNVFYDY